MRRPGFGPQNSYDVIGDLKKLLSFLEAQSLSMTWEEGQVTSYDLPLLNWTSMWWKRSTLRAAEERSSSCEELLKGWQAKPSNIL